MLDYPGWPNLMTCIPKSCGKRERDGMMEERQEKFETIKRLALRVLRM